VKWTDESISKGIYSLMELLNVDRMPTHTEMKEHRCSGLGRAIGLTGGIHHWSDKLGVPMKEKEKYWNDERIRKGIYEVMKSLQLDRMPTASEITSLGRNDLHCGISKSKDKYSGWAKKLDLGRKDSETNKGNEYERFIAERIRRQGFEVKEMTTKHPYDLLVEGTLRIDVKVGSAHNHFGSRAHTFAPNKKYPTCDLYICVALDEKGSIENTFIIPSKFAQLVTLNIGKESKYNKFIDRWDYIERFISFYEKVN
jgi:hypothetical protein